MLAARDNLLSLEREVVSLFGHVTGVDQIAILKVTVKTGTVEFAVGETVTAQAGGTGIVYAIRSVAGTWTVGGASGTCVLDLKTTAGTFTADGTLTGSVAGAGVQNGAGVADIAYQNPTFVARKAKGVASIVCDTTVAGTAGLYTITLQDKWGGLLGFNATVMDATTPKHWEVTVVSETVATTKTIIIQVFAVAASTADKVVADIQADDKLFFEIVLSNASSTSLAGY